MKFLPAIVVMCAAVFSGWPQHGQAANKNGRIDEYSLACDGVTDGGLAVAQTLQKLFKCDHPLAALASAEQLSEDGKISADLLEQIRAIAGAERQHDDGQGEVCAKENGKLQAVTAIVHISALAKRDLPDVIIINESHRTQLHRAFSYALIKALFSEGYTSLAGEAFSANVALSLEDGAPDVGSGSYVLDPIYGDLIRVVHAKGMDVFDYDNGASGNEDNLPPIESANARESRQAAAIAKYGKRHPGRRIVVIAGSGHGIKMADSTGIRWMASRLVADFDMSVLSIDQVFGTPHHGQYVFFGQCVRTSEINLMSPSVLLDEQGRLLARAGFDLTVFHPVPRLERGRPDWVTLSGDRQFYRIKLKPTSARTQVRAYYADEPQGSLAVDQVVVNKDVAWVWLALPNGRFRVVREDERGVQRVIDVIRTARN